MATLVAHEIKNPLVSIGGLARVLQKRATDETKVREIASVIQDEVDRLERILENVLQFRRDRSLRCKPVSLHRILKRTVKLLSSELKRASIQVRWDLSKSIPRILADEDKIKQVCMNMCTNAVQAMPDGGTLTFHMERSGEGVVLEISDTGYGITREHLDKVFDPFFTTKDRGTGLGLAICDQLVRDHGGSIQVESELGKGTKFRIHLPSKPDRIGQD